MTNETTDLNLPKTSSILYALSPTKNVAKTPQNLKLKPKRLHPNRKNNPAFQVFHRAMSHSTATSHVLSNFSYALEREQIVVLKIS